MLKYMSGVPTADIGKAKKKKSKEEKKKKKQGKKGGVRKKVAKVGLAPSRAAFLLATRMNVLKLGKRLRQAYKADASRVTAFWTKIGGNFDALKEAIEKGSKQSLDGVPTGDIGIVTETAIATATPIVIAVVKLFKDLKSDKPGDDADDANAIAQGKNDLANDPNIDKGNATMNTDQESGIAKGDESGMGMSTPLIIGGVAVAAFLLMRKKKQ